MSSTPRGLLSYLRAEAGAWRNDARDDAELITRFVDDGDESAFQALVCRYGAMVWQSCARVLGTGPDTEDAFQTTFWTLSRKIHKLRRESLAGWLQQVARRTAIKMDVKERKLRSLEHELFTTLQSVVEDNPDRTELYAILEEELASLSEHLRIPLVLRYLEGKTLEEVARIIGCSRRVLSDRLLQGEAALRARLERRIGAA